MQLSYAASGQQCKGKPCIAGTPVNPSLPGLFTQKGNHIIKASTSQDGFHVTFQELGGGWYRLTCVHIQDCENSTGLHYSPLVNLTVVNIHQESQWKVKRTLKHAKIQWRLMYHSKSFKITISIHGMVFTNLCTACSDTHSLILHIYTATYVHTQPQTYLHNFVHTY